MKSLSLEGWAANISGDSPLIIESDTMPLKPYPSITKVAALAAREGHVVAVEDGITVIETGTEKVSFSSDRSITDSSGASITMDEALKRLKIKL